MTRPIFEPTTQRQIAGLKYGTRQLFRRPPVATALSSALLVGTKADFQSGGFTQFYDDGTVQFETNDPVLFENDGVSVYIQANDFGMYEVFMQVEFFLSHGSGGAGPFAAIDRAPLPGEVIMEYGCDVAGFDPLILEQYWWSFDHHYLLNGASYEGTMTASAEWDVLTGGSPTNIFAPFTIVKTFLADTIQDPFQLLMTITRLGPPTS